MQKLLPVSGSPTRKEKHEKAVTDGVEPVTDSPVVQQELPAHDFAVAQDLPAFLEPAHRRKRFVHCVADVLEVALNVLHGVTHVQVLRLLLPVPANVECCLSVPRSSGLGSSSNPLATRTTLVIAGTSRWPFRAL